MGKTSDAYALLLLFCIKYKTKEFLPSWRPYIQYNVDSVDTRPTVSILKSKSYYTLRDH